MKVAARDVNYQFWANVYNTAIGFILFVILAHFLAPPEFGLYALGTVIAAILYTLGQAGFVSLAYSAINRGETILNTLFWANIITAFVLVSVASALIYLVVSQPDRRIFLIGLISTLVITSIPEIANVALLTAQRFRELAAKQVAVQTIGAAAALVAVYAGAGAWSLTIQRGVGGLIEFAAVFFLLRWRPRFIFDFNSFRRLLPTAIGFVGNASLAVLEVRLADLVIATVSTLDQLAAYRIAGRVFDSLLSLIVQPISSVASAAVAAAQSNRGAIYLAHVRLLLWIGAAPFAGLLCFGDVIIPWVFGQTWAESGSIAQILATQFFVAGPVWLTDNALIATGRPKELVVLRVLATLTSAPLILLFAQMGTEFIALSITVRSALLLSRYVRATYFLTGLSTFRTLKLASIPYLTALGSAGLARAVFEVSRLLGTLAPLALGIGIVAGGAIYSVLFLKFGRPEFRSIVTWRDANKS